MEHFKHKIVQRNVRLANPLTLREVENFETQYQIRLPEEYRRFLLELGDGGDGPPAYGLLPLAKTTKNRVGNVIHPDLPFPLTEYWVWEDDAELDEEGLNAVQNNGHLYLGTDGCGMDWLLIVSGAERGRIWQLTDVGAQPCAPRLDFRSWYKYWLDGGDDWFAAWDKKVD